MVLHINTHNLYARTLSAIISFHGKHFRSFQFIVFCVRFFFVSVLFSIHFLGVFFCDSSFQCFALFQIVIYFCDFFLFKCMVFVLPENICWQWNQTKYRGTIQSMENNTPDVALHPFEISLKIIINWSPQFISRTFYSFVAAQLTSNVMTVFFSSSSLQYCVFLHSIRLFDAITARARKK